MSQPIDEAVTKTLTSIENVAPKAWGLLVEAQKIHAGVEFIQSIIWILAFVAVISVALTMQNKKQWLKKWRDSRDPELVFVFVFGITLAAFGVLLFVGGLIDDYNQYYHPDVYAAKALIDKIK